MEAKIGVDAITKALAQNTLQWQNILQQSNPERKVKASSRKQFGCDYCNRKFVYLTGLRRHVKKFHPDKIPLVPAEQTVVSAPSDMHPKTVDVVLKCKNCGQIFPDVKSFEAHSLRYNWEQLLIEVSLDTNENGMLLFAGQISIVVIHAAVACEFCDALFSDYASLFYHEAHHTPASGYACTFCKLNFPNLQAVLDHRAQCYECINFRTTRLLNVCILYSCNSCMATFATLPELYEHRYSNHHYFPRRNVALSKQDVQLDGLWLCCEICGFTIDNIYELFNHRNKVHSVAGIGERGVTEKPASTQRAVKRANKVESDHCRQFLCDKCGKTYTQSSHLWQHLRFHNGIRPFVCTVQGCTRRFTIRPDLNDHVRKCHTGERPYECDVCHKRFLTGSVYYQHRCNSCMATFATLPELYEHRYSNHHYFPRRNVALSKQDVQLDGLWLCCEICGFTIDNIYELFNHRNKVHSVAGIGERGVTEKPASTQRAVKRANKVESDHCRQFLCDKCGKTYTQSSHLWQHLRFHNGIRPFVCTVQGCTRRFTIRPDLNDHVRKCHTGERPYECDVCHKRFLTGSVYYQHRLIHRNERRHACNDCDSRFYRADALKNHRRIHTGEKPYACTHCDRKFRQRGDREKHVRVKHMKYR
uniref:C2H2-type domain-containing protein n=1 Tax=Anopheles minimus TaxID=112268 RepID=A0A182VTD3_9DIPT